MFMEDMLLIRLVSHLWEVSHLWDIGIQDSPRCDAAECGVPYGAILFALRNFIEILNKISNPDLKSLKMKVDSSD